MNRDSTTKRSTAGRIILSTGLIISLGLTFGPAMAGEPAQGSQSDEILAVDIPYNLFLSLARYEDLTEAERRGESVNSELIPVLETIVGALEKERNRFEPLLARGAAGVDIRQRLAQMGRLIDDYKNELRYRRKAIELDRLLDQQKTLLGGE